MDTSVEVIGWMGSILFSICGVPQVIKTFKTKRADDLSHMFLWFWFLGEILTLIYIVYTDIQKENYHFPLYFNYIFNLIIVSYLIYAKFQYSEVRVRTK